VNAYRASLANPLPAVAISSSLSKVGQAHAWDLATNNPNTGTDPAGVGAGPCNMHSWSARPEWTNVCYTSDHAYAAGMWNKPGELTSYKASGFEIAFRGGGEATAAGALAAWQSSSGHNNVITENGWQRFNAMGVGMKGQYAVVWFGFDADPAAPIPACL
jgi:hypothetical protein